jgi:hypothetical protein
MFWRKFGKRTREDPEQLRMERERREDLKRRLTELFASSGDSQFTLRHLDEKLGNISAVSLAIVLAELQEQGLVDRIVRVESPESHGGIKDFTSLDDVPNEIYDWRTQQTIPVTPENITLVFRAHRANNLAHANA